jgi:hypothetical protein
MYQVNQGADFLATTNNFLAYGFFDRTRCPVAAEAEWNAFKDNGTWLTPKPTFQLQKTFQRVVQAPGLSYTNYFRNLNVEPRQGPNMVASCANIPTSGPWPDYAQAYCPAGPGMCQIQDGSSFGILSFDYYPQCGVNPSMLLANSKSALVNSLQTQLKTIGMSRANYGLFWGWAALSPVWRGVIDPAQPALPRDYTGRKIAILMTQGNNFRNFATGVWGDDTRLQQTCNAMKAQGITLYTVALDASNGGTNSILQNCASSADGYITGTDPNAVAARVSAIADTLRRPHIVR